MTFANFPPLGAAAEGRLAFLVELDRLKGVLRRTLLHDGSRHENSAEHSWHLATAVVVMESWANEPVDLPRAVKMALAHDIVEIDAGDTLVYDLAGCADKQEREERAARRLFGMLPPELEREFTNLWRDYEALACPESRFVLALDRFLPILANFQTGGRAWRENNIRKAQVLERNAVMARGSEKLWDVTREMIETAARLGFLEE